MKPIFLLLVFAILVFRGGPILPSLIVAVLLTVVLSIVLHIVGKAVRNAMPDKQPQRIQTIEPARGRRSARKKSAPKSVTATSAPT